MVPTTFLFREIKRQEKHEQIHEQIHERNNVDHCEEKGRSRLITNSNEMQPSGSNEWMERIEPIT